MIKMFIIFGYLLVYQSLEFKLIFDKAPFANKITKLFSQGI